MRAKNMGFIQTIRKIPTRETEPRRDNVVSKIHFFRTIERINFESGNLRTNSSRTKRMRCFASQCSALSDKNCVFCKFYSVYWCNVLDDRTQKRRGMGERLLRSQNVSQANRLSRYTTLTEKSLFIHTTMCIKSLQNVRVLTDTPRTPTRTWTHYIPFAC